MYEWNWGAKVEGFLALEKVAGEPWPAQVILNEAMDRLQSFGKLKQLRVCSGEDNIKFMKVITIRVLLCIIISTSGRARGYLCNTQCYLECQDEII